MHSEERRLLLEKPVGNDNDSDIINDGVGHQQNHPLKPEPARCQSGASPPARRSKALRGARFRLPWHRSPPPSLRERARPGRGLCAGGRVGAAAYLIRDAVLGSDRVEDPAAGAYDPSRALDSSPSSPSRTVVVIDAVAVACRRWCRSGTLRRVLHAAVGMLVALTFLEPPHWCRHHRVVDDDDGAEHFGCAAVWGATGVPAGAATDGGEGTGSVEYYPNTGSNTWLTVAQSHTIEAVCGAVVALVLLLRVGRDGLSLPRYLRRSPVRRNRLIQLFCVAALPTGLLLERWSPAPDNKYTLYHAYLRLLLLYSFLGASQREIEVLHGILPEVFNILLLLFVITLFYAWFGVVMFVGTAEGALLFPNLVEGLWTLWICVTTANYPDVMMPAYNENRFVALYFISFMVVSFFFLTNVILASVVNEYDTAVLQHRSDYTEMSTTNLKTAYQLLTLEEPDAKGGDNGGSVVQPERINREIVMDLLTILNNDFPEFRRLSDDDTQILFAILDRDGSSLISEEEFMDFGSVLLLDLVKSSDYATFVEARFPRLFRSDGWRRFCDAVKAPSFDWLIDVVLVANAVVVAIQSWPALTNQVVVLDSKLMDGSIDTVWEYFETGFTVIYTLEVMIKIAVYGWKTYLEQMKNVFDLTITAMAIVSAVVVYYPNDYSDSRLIRMILAARVLRLVRVLTALKPFQQIGRISAVILPAATSVLVVLFLIMYLFAALGMQLYGGMITRDPNNPLAHRILNTAFSESQYWANNFNDMGGGMNVLFNLLVVNNWFVCEVGFEAATQAKWVRLYFLAFHVLGVILVNNLVIAFIINKFLQELAVVRNERRDVEELLGVGQSVRLRDDRAVFNASKVTGTRTNLRGDYIARIRHTNSDIADAHRRERLRSLFTQTSSAVIDEEG